MSEENSFEVEIINNIPEEVEEKSSDLSVSVGDDVDAGEAIG